MSIEAVPPGQCRSLVGKDLQNAYWLGTCSAELHSLLDGPATMRQAGVIPPFHWSHVAVAFDGNRRRHCINGGPVGTSPVVLRIGSDVSWPFTPSGSPDGVRLW